MLCQLLERDGAKLRSQARLHSQRPTDAEDALQDACVQFLRFYDGPSEEALRWMYVVVKRCAWAIGRRASRVRESGGFHVSGAGRKDARCEVIPADESAEPAAAAERREAVLERIALLDELKPNERHALLLLGMGYSYREIGQGLGWTHTKVNRCIAEGRAALRQEGQRVSANSLTG